MPTVVPAEGVILERVLEMAPGLSPERLSREAYATFDTAQMKTAWGRDHRRRCALALVFSDLHPEHRPAGFDLVSMTEAELTVTESTRRGAPMTDPRRSISVSSRSRRRFRSVRDYQEARHGGAGELLQLLAGPGARQLHFFIAEEGITAAAYVVVSIVAGTWTIEECGDRDPSGARVGAILQALIAREPVGRRPAIRAWFPRGFVPPQVTIVSTKPSTDMLMVRSLGSTAVPPRLSGDDVLYWRSDTF